MPLKTGRRIHAGQWIVLIFTKLVIDRVEKPATDEGIDKLVDIEMIFEWEPG